VGNIVESKVNVVFVYLSWDLDLDWDWACSGMSGFIGWRWGRWGWCFGGCIVGNGWTFISIGIIIYVNEYVDSVIDGFGDICALTVLFVESGWIGGGVELIVGRHVVVFVGG
jgi:hypothetical protein